MNDHLEIRDLRSFHSQQLAPLLRAEAERWQRRLLWNYAKSLELLAQYVDAHILQGLVAVDRSSHAPVGYCFSVYEAQKAVIGDIFAEAPAGASYTTTDIEEALMVPTIETLIHTPGTLRIEAQLLLHDSGWLRTVFQRQRFLTYKRQFLQATLTRDIPEPTYELPKGLRLVQWLPSHFQHAGELVYRCYQRHGDSAINDQYRSVHGSLRFLHNIVRFPGCGIFLPDMSWVLWDERTHSMEGMVLVSTVDEYIAHITQICVAPQRRGSGLGHLLLSTALHRLARADYSCATLTATEANADAMHLYHAHGFTERVSFDAAVWEKFS